MRSCAGIETWGIVQVEGVRLYAYEVDGLGNSLVSLAGRSCGHWCLASTSGTVPGPLPAHAHALTRCCTCLQVAD